MLIESYAMSLTRAQFLPLVITRGSDQVAVSSKFEVRNDVAVVRNYGMGVGVTQQGIYCWKCARSYLMVSWPSFHHIYTWNL